MLRRFGLLLADIPLGHHPYRPDAAGNFPNPKNWRRNTFFVVCGIMLFYYHAVRLEFMFGRFLEPPTRPFPMQKYFRNAWLDDPDFAKKQKLFEHDLANLNTPKDKDAGHH